MSKKRGTLMVLSGCSGVGKGTVIAILREKMPDLFYSVSVTTRMPRDGEMEGENYYFRTQEEFDQMVRQGAFVEYASYAKHSYGTPEAPLEEHLQAGQDVLVEIDVQGALQIRKKRKDAVLVFLVPPSFEELEHRLRGRGTEDEETISRRLSIARRELEQASQYDYRVVNDWVEDAVKKLSAIFLAEKCRDQVSFSDEDMRNR